MTVHPSVLQLSKRLAVFMPIPGIVAAAVFLFSLSRVAYPGYSAALTAAAAGLVPPSGAAHPLFALAARAVASIDVFSLPVRLNLFSAFCGTACTMLLYLLVSRLLLFSVCDGVEWDGTIGLRPSDDEDEANRFPKLTEDAVQDNGKLLKVAVAGGLVAALLFAFAVPVWSASIRLDNGVFDLLIALAALSLFTTDETQPHGIRLSASAFLFALGLFESAAFLLLLPGYAFFLFRAVYFSPRRVASGYGVIFAGALAAACAVCAFWQNVGQAEALTLLTAARAYVPALLAHHHQEALSFFPRPGWVLLVVQIGVPVALLLFGRHMLFKDKSASTVIALFLLVFASAPRLLNLTLSPYFIFESAGHLPVFGNAVIAAAAAVVFVVCLILVKPGDEQEGGGAADGDLADDWDARLERRNKVIIRSLAGCLLAGFLVLTPVSLWRSRSEVRSSGGDFADQAAREIVTAMKERTWLISDGILDNHLLIQAAVMKKPLTLVNLHTKPIPREEAQLRRLIDDSPAFDGLNRQRLLDAFSDGPVRFVTEWFSLDPDAGRAVMVFATPNIWTACGYRAVPEGLAFGGIPADRAPELKALIEQNEAFSDRASTILGNEGNGRGYAAALREVLRMKAGFAANELGVLLEEAGDYESAWQSYARALKIDPGNVSAAINGYLLEAERKLHPDALGAQRKRVRATLEIFVRRKVQSPGCGAIIQNYGTVRQQAEVPSARGADTVAHDRISKALALSKETGAAAYIENAAAYLQPGDTAKAKACDLAALEEAVSDADALAGMCMLMLYRRNAPEAEEWMQKALAADAPKERVLYQTVMLAMFKNDDELALNLLRDAVKEAPTDLRYWTLLADILLERGDTQAVELQILPQMQKALKNPSHFMVHAFRGFLFRKKGPEFYKEARLYLLSALSLNAALPAVWRTLFELDLALGNPEFTEADERSLLSRETDIAKVNYLMGALRQESGALREAEDSLRRGVEKNPTAEGYNDLAENLRQQNRLEEAETFARRALAIQAEFPPALDTLARILCEVSKYDEAARMAEKAVAAKPDLPCYQFTLLRAHVKKGDRDEVAQRQRILAASKTQIPDSLLREIKEMR